MSTIRTNAILDSAGGNTATINGAYIRPGVLDPENRIINGGFDFWQRGTSQATSGYNSADRWLQTISGGTVTMSRQPFTLGDTLGANSPTFFLRQSVSGQSLAGHLAVVQQPIESVRSYAGQTITILGWARRSSGSGNMAVSMNQEFGTGGSPSASVAGIGAAVVALTGSWVPFAVTISVPSIAGKTLGSNNNDRLTLNFWSSAGSDLASQAASLGLQTIGVDLWGIHIKLGTHTTAAVDLYKQPELGPEFDRCLRYYQLYDGLFALVANNAAANANSKILPVQMRGTPSVTQVTASGTGAVWNAFNKVVYQTGVHSIDAGTGTLRLDAEL